MAHESFCDLEIAEILNNNYVSIKLDREERPDIDSVYMSFCQAMTGSGGWPLTVIMTPDKEPFFTGTYFPKKKKFDYTGLEEILTYIVRQWKFNKNSLISSSSHIRGEVEKIAFAEEHESFPLDKSLITAALKEFESTFDSKYGGFGNAPKFPSPHIYMFLLRTYVMEGANQALNMAESTLIQMYKGGIFDHIGYGFSRYSTDEKWLVPHFEKMLYDNALLSLAYLECYQVTENPLYANIVQKIFTYIEREMLSPEGGFYSAQDADSDGVEGKYYLLSKNEIIDQLGQSDGREFCNAFGISREGNFEGLNIPNLLHSEALDEIKNSETIMEKLYTYRKNRTKLHKDDKFLTSWNSLMVAAYAKAFRVLGGENYRQMAENAFEFIEKNLVKDGEIFISHREGQSYGNGLLDDYAFFCYANLLMYEALFEPEYIIKAVKTAEKALELFSDDKGVMFLSRKNTELILRPKETYDGAMPSGNSVMALCLMKLSAITGNLAFTEAAEKQISALQNEIRKAPRGHTFALIALMEAVYPAIKLVCVTKDSEVSEEIKEKLKNNLYTGLTVVLFTEGDKRLAEVIPSIAEYTVPADKSAAFFICRGEVCQTPIFDLDEIFGLL